MKLNYSKLPLKQKTILKEVSKARELFWQNPQYEPYVKAQKTCAYDRKDILEAQKLWERFAPLIRYYFPETADRCGRIESPLTLTECLKKRLEKEAGIKIKGEQLIKRDSDLPIAGSVKARGGIFEICKYTEELAEGYGILKPGDSYLKLAENKSREVFHDHTIQVGSTGNLGISIGIISAVFGYRTVVHMSADAKEWKKELLRGHGVVVVEYEGDYAEAVRKGREQSKRDSRSYFVDDENSRSLFMGYATAALEIQEQLHEAKIQVDREHPLFVYLPCGIGGAPGGITFGLKQIFGDQVHCFFVEPTQAPCMLAGLLTGLHSQISVQDLGLTGKTQADGLAVGRASGFVGKTMEQFISGVLTVDDEKLCPAIRMCYETEGIFMEPSAGSAIWGPVRLFAEEEGREYMKKMGCSMEGSTHMIWATGGRFVPDEIRKQLLE